VEEIESETKKKMRLRNQFSRETQCKEKIEIDIYLEDNEWDVKAAVEAFKNDQQWEADHPNAQKPRTDNKKKKRQYEGSMLTKVLPNWKN